MIKAGLNVKTSFSESWNDPNFEDILLEMMYPSNQNATANPPEEGDLFCDPGAIYDRVYEIVGTPVRQGATNDFMCVCTGANFTPSGIGDKPVVSSGGAISTPNRNGFAPHFDNALVTPTAAFKASGYNIDYQGAEDPSMPADTTLADLANEVHTARGGESTLGAAVTDKVSKTDTADQQVVSNLRVNAAGKKLSAPEIDTVAAD